MFIANKDARQATDKPLSQLYRPLMPIMPGNSSASAMRVVVDDPLPETAARVAAGALAAILLRQVGVAVHAWVTQVSPIAMQQQA